MQRLISERVRIPLQPAPHADGRVPNGAWSHRGARRADLRRALRRGGRSEGVEAPGGVTAMDGGSSTQPDKRVCDKFMGRNLPFRRVAALSDCLINIQT